MNAFVVTQQPAPQAGWALQYTPDLKPAGARTYEPDGAGHAHDRVEHRAPAAVLSADRRHEVPGADPRGARLARRREAAARRRGDRGPGGPTRRSSRSGRTSRSTCTAAARTSSTASTTSTATRTNTIGHYSSFRQVDVARLRKDYLRRRRCRRPRRRRARRFGRAPGVRRCRATSPSGSHRRSALTPDAAPADRAARAVASLDAQGRWIAPLGSTSHPYRGDGSKEIAPGDFSRTQVGDETDTSPYRADPGIVGISTSTYIRNMGELIRFLGEDR